MFFAADAQTIFYITGTVFMAVATLVLVGTIIALLVIQSKIRTMQKNIKNKVDLLSRIPKKGTGFMSGFLRSLTR